MIFYERLLEFGKFYYSKDPLIDKILPYISDSSLKSILKLSSFDEKKVRCC